MWSLLSKTSHLYHVSHLHISIKHLIKIFNIFIQDKQFIGDSPGDIQCIPLVTRPFYLHLWIWLLKSSIFLAVDLCITGLFQLRLGKQISKES